MCKPVPSQFLENPIKNKLAVDLFAGGGGASTGMRKALGRDVDIAINHNPDAIGMHAANHPGTKHYIADVFEVCPREATGGRPVGILHASPDCTHHSQAKGGQPRRQEIRSLAWVVHRWAGIAKPDLISLENVEQMILWAPLIAKRCKETGRVITLDQVVDASGRKGYRVAAPGEHVPRHNQFLVPDPRSQGRNWQHFVEGLRRLGYKVEWRVIVNANYGSHSTRRRLHLIARRDGFPIIWPKATHSKGARDGLARWNPISNCIDWSVGGTSIFGRKKDLAAATLRRIAHGLKRFVIDSSDPFIVPGVRSASGKTEASTIIQTGYGEREGQAPRVLDLSKPLGTVVAGGNKFGLTAACMIQMGHGEGADGSARWSYGANDIRNPVGAITASGAGQGLSTAFMVQANGGFNTTHARSVQEPASTVTTSGSQQQLLTAKTEPVVPMSRGLSPADEKAALRCANFLLQYQRTPGAEPTELSDSEKLALVTVHVDGVAHVIVDIHMRGLIPRELYRAQDFPDGYIIDRTASGKVLTKTAQIKMCGNSVSPVPLSKILVPNIHQQEPTAEDEPDVLAA